MTLARYDVERLHQAYEAAERVVDHGLRRDDSLFTPGVPIWSRANFEELDRLYVQAPNFAEGTFEEKLRVQIGQGSPDAVQLMAELHYVYFLPASVNNVSAETKLRRIQAILDWLPTPVTVPPDLADALGLGFGGVGQGFNQYKWASLSYLVSFGLEWKRATDEVRAHALVNPEDFLAAVDSVPTGPGTYAREALLFLVHPAFFERVFSRGEKQAIADRFATLVDDAAQPVDLRIRQIRRRLEERFGSDVDFYGSVPLRAMWRPRGEEWPAFLYWAERYQETPTFDVERNYKLELAEALGAAKAALWRGGDDWLEPLTSALRSRNNNLVSWRDTDTFLKWVSRERDQARRAMGAVWAPDAGPLESLGAFLADLPKEAVPSPGSRVALGSVLLMATDPRGLPPYRPTPLQLAYKLTNFGASETEEVARYGQALAFFDELLSRASAQGLQLGDRLGAQAATWCVTSNDIPPEWPEEDRQAFAWYRAQAGVFADEEPDVDVDLGSTPPRQTDPLAQLAKELLIDEEDLKEIAQLLEARKQVVFYGPPGTGKTYVARRLARTLAGDPARSALVQFHPSYSYEDFVQGYRPRLNEGHASFELVDGPLLRLARQAASDPDHLHVLVIDELNRGNVAKVLGELYFLLEYRDELIDLQYSPVKFAMPPNLRIIGTMNTADRSIAVLDAALRRRFAFIPFFPDRPPIEGLLRRWLSEHRAGMRWVADVVDLANVRLADRNGAIGPSFFMVSSLDDAQVGLSWRHQILPYLEDYFFDDPARLDEFDLERLKAEATATSSAGRAYAQSEPPPPDSASTSSGRADAAGPR